MLDQDWDLKFATIYYRNISFTLSHNLNGLKIAKKSHARAIIIVFKEKFEKDNPLESNGQNELEHNLDGEDNKNDETNEENRSDEDSGENKNACEGAEEDTGVGNETIEKEENKQNEFLKEKHEEEDFLSSHRFPVNSLVKIFDAPPKKLRDCIKCLHHVFYLMTASCNLSGILNSESPNIVQLKKQTPQILMNFNQLMHSVDKELKGINLTTSNEEIADILKNFLTSTQDSTKVLQKPKLILIREMISVQVNLI
eukprot:c20296_g1_i4.p1 GENE.c20296_g1_i4~~c20296_g1_i4.p1  ORF type:complete len:255 (-),score=86.94 c20296_g1_i4:163-927(-)